MSENLESPLEQFANLYLDGIETGLAERRIKCKPDVYDSEVYEVTSALIARQAALTSQLAASPGIWNGHAAPLFLRCQIDAHITLAWILKDPVERQKRCQKYIYYGLGQEKLALEHLKAEHKRSPSEEIGKLIKLKTEWINMQRWEFLTEVNIGNWANIDTRKMAEEAGCLDLYRFSYAPFSGIAHNMWQHIGIYNMQHCQNPMHLHHKIPTIGSEFNSPQIDFVFRSAKYANMSFQLYDEAFSLSPSPLLPSTVFQSAYDEAGKVTADEL